MEVMNQDIKPFAEMSNTELFCVLTGDRGIMAQYELQQLVRGYIAKYENEADLHTMVVTMLNEEE